MSSIADARKAQIAWWALKVWDEAQEHKQAHEYATADKSVTGKLDRIRSIARDLHFELTGELPEAII